MSSAERQKFEAEKDTYTFIERNESSVSGSYYVRCGAGHTDKLVAFNLAHSKDLRKDLEKRTDLDMDCFDAPDHIKALDRMLAKTNEILDMLKVENAKKDKLVAKIKRKGNNKTLQTKTLRKVRNPNKPKKK
jgi:hypothetical protein